MSTFTVTLKRAMELDPEIENRILANYPIFDEEYRPHLNETITDQFLNREIGQETISMFKLSLKRKLNQIMPRMNQQYEASRLEFDPLQTMSVKSVARGENSTVSQAESTNESASDAKSRGVAQDFPQTALAGNGDYASSAQDNTSNTTATGASVEQGNTTGTDSNESDTTGSSGHTAMLIYQYRQTIVNVDEMVLQELESIFMQVWDNGDNFSSGNYYSGVRNYGNHYNGFPV